MQLGKNMEKIKRGQTALEFLLIIAFMTIVFVSVFALANSRLADTLEQKSYETASAIASIVTGQIETASTVNGGFSTVFIIPQTVEGKTYSIAIIDQRELVVIFEGFEYVEFLPVNVSGSLRFGENVLSKGDDGGISITG